MSEIAGIQQAVWLRAEGGCAVVLVEVDGEWVEIIREMLDSPFSHIKEPSADLVPAPPSQAQPDVTEAMVEAMVEAENVLVSLSENVAKHGNYTPGKHRAFRRSGTKRRPRRPERTGRGREMSDLPRMLHLTRKSGEPIVVAMAHVVAIVPMKDGSTEILTTPGIVYAVQESVAAIDRQWR